MRVKAFTIIEMLVAIIILGVLATLAINQYQGFVENADAQVCETNLKALQTSLDLYALEHDTVPAAVSEIPEKYIEKAFASIMRQKGSWKTKLAYLVVDWKNSGFAYAQTLDRLRDLAKGNTSILRCPKVPIGQESYGINSIILGQSIRFYRRIKREFPNFLAIMESDNAEVDVKVAQKTVTTATAQFRHFHRGSSTTSGFNCAVTVSGNTLRELGKEMNIITDYDPKIDFDGFIKKLMTGAPTCKLEIDPSGITSWPEYTP
jgi:type IV pilus assembly protein PilA